MAYIWPEAVRAGPARRSSGANLPAEEVEPGASDERACRIPAKLGEEQDVVMSEFAGGA